MNVSSYIPEDMLKLATGAALTFYRLDLFLATKKPKMALQVDKGTAFTQLRIECLNRDCYRRLLSWHINLLKQVFIRTKKRTIFPVSPIFNKIN